MKIATRKGRFTFEDFCFLVKDGEKADLIDGVIYMASPDNLDADDLYGWLFWLLSGFVDARELGRVFGSRVAFRLSRKQSPEPDISFLAVRHFGRKRRGHVLGPPDLAMEIVSPESIDRDYILKRAQYENAGVAEYWIVDEMERRLTLLRLDENGKYQEVQSRRGELHSDVLPGFWLRTEWLWQRRPKKMRVLNKILARKV